MTDAETTTPFVAPPQPGVSPEIAAYVAHLEADAGLHRIGERLHFVTGYGPNINFIEGDDGVIVVNAGNNVGVTAQALALFREHCDKPIRAVIYTHGYLDHIGGVRALVPRGEEDGVRVFCQADWRRLMRATVGPSQKEVAVRGGSQIGSYLPPGDAGTLGSILNRWISGSGGSSFLAPTDDIAVHTQVTISGVELELVPAPHDVDVGLVVWMPAERILFAGDVLLPGFMLPTIATPRFEARRDPQAWTQTMGLAASFGAETLIPAYGSYVAGAETVKRQLVSQQKLSQFLIDETYRRLFAGETAQAIAEHVTIPPELCRDVPYNELYHRLFWIVRSLISREFGWFNGDPLDYVRHPATDRARRLSDELGGVDAMLERGRRAYEAEDFAWSLELATETLLVTPDDTRALDLRRASLQALAYASPSSNERNVLLSAVAMEDGRLTRPMIFAGLSRSLSELSLVRSPAALLDILGPKLVCDRVGDDPLWVRFELGDRDETLDLAVIDGVMLRGPDPDRDAPDLVLRMSFPDLTAAVEGVTPFDDLRDAGRVKIITGAPAWERLVSSFSW
jgi:uncharacterized sulfatase